MTTLNWVNWDEAREALWPYQRDAVDAVDSFLQDSEPRSFIVTMPTGSGKSGVIAYVAQSRATEKDVLLLCPWAALADQLRRDVTHRFWDHASVDSSGMRRAVRLMPKKAQSEIEKADGPSIWIMTLAALQRLPYPARALLMDRLGLVIVDEGHYEPAPTWAKAVRNLSVPSLIFTATPFRNDRKFFAVGRGDNFHYSLRRALDEKVLREPSFELLGDESAEAFVEGLSRFAAKKLTAKDRLIVRCSTADQIRGMVKALRVGGFSAIGIHERFAKDDESQGLLHRVPPDHEARVWVHQNKLVEGIDNGSFRAIAFYSGFGNDRALVQQIGRVLRDPKRSPKAWILSPDPDRLERTWNAFLDFDEHHDATESPYEAIVEASRAHAGYFGGTFRHPLDPENLDEREVRIPRAVSVFTNPDGLQAPFDTAVELLNRVLDEEDAVKIGPLLSESTTSFDARWVLQLHVVPTQSPLLAESAYVDAALGFTFLAGTHQRLYVQSTIRLDLGKLGFRPLGTMGLHQVFDATKNQFTSISLRNTDLSVVAERSRTQSAASLAAVAPDLGDYFRAPATITGIADSTGSENESKPASRYVGFGNARIREHGRLSLEDYLGWLAVVDAQIDRRAQVASIFSRFAEPTECADPVIDNVLLDFDGADFFADALGESLAIADECVDVAPDGTFELHLESEDAIGATLKWESSRFEFRSPDLDDRFSLPGESSQIVSLSITEQQAFRLIVHDRAEPDSLIQYVNGGFVRTRTGLAVDDARDGVALDLLLTPNPFTDVRTEKGPKDHDYSDGAWPDDSIFNRVSHAVTSLELFGADVEPDAVLVCDDDSHEKADFYLVERTRRRLTVIHAKAKDNADPGAGASGLHDVIAQAQKHLGTMRPGGAGFDRTTMADRWSRDWYGHPIPRMRSNHDSGSAADAVWTALRDPRYSREVLVIAAGIVSKEKLIGAARAGSPQALQAIYLLQAGWASAAATGASFRVITNP